jgi:glycosyltransferase involved in cell wall biosynthesis
MNRPGAGGASPLISLVVAVYQRQDFLELVLESLLNQTFRDFEIIIADDGSGPEMAETIDRYRSRFEWPIRHEWHEDDGFRKTVIVNRAVAGSSADYLVFIDGDCILHRKFLARHFRRRRRGWVLTGRRVMLDAELTGRLTADDVRRRRIEGPAYWLGHCGRNDCKHGFYAPFVFGIRNRTRKNYEILGSNFSVFRDDFYAINGYDERITGRGLEDNNLCARFINAGVKVKSVAFEALQYHCFHPADAIPHSREFIDAYRDSSEGRTPYGITKD